MAHKIGIDARKLDDYGIGTYIRHLVDALAALDSDHRYYLLVAERHVERLDHLPVNFEPVVENAPVYSARELVTVSWKLARLGLDLYHATHYVLPLWVPAKTVVTIHDIIHLLYPQFLPGPLAFFYAQRMIRRSLTLGDRILADSENTRTDLKEYFEIDGRRIRVIYPGVDESFHEKLPTATIDLQLDGLGLERPYVLFVGNPKPHKNLENVVRAFGRALELKSFEADLVCVGGRESRTFKLQRLAERHGFGERLRLVAHVEDSALKALYQGATLFLYPTLYEGFGLPVVEAMASGTPVITSASSALKEVAEGHADLVDPLDVEEMARAIAHSMTDPEHRASLAERGRRRAEDFLWRRTAEQTLEVYEQVLGIREPAP